MKDLAAEANKGLSTTVNALSGSPALIFGVLVILVFSTLFGVALYWGHETRQASEAKIVGLLQVCIEAQHLREHAPP